MVDRGSDMDHLDQLARGIDVRMGTAQLIRVGLTKTHKKQSSF